MLAIHARFFEAVREYVTDFATRFQRAAHCCLIDAFGAAGDDRSSRASRELANSHRVVNQGLIHVTRADYCKSTRLQKADFATAIEYRRSVLPQFRLQSPWVVGIGPAYDPNGAGLPSLDDLAQQKAAPEQTLETALINDVLART